MSAHPREPAPARLRVSLPKLAVLPLEGLQLLGHVGRNAGSLPAVDLGPLDPVVQRLGVQPILAAIEVTAAQREACSPA